MRIKLAPNQKVLAENPIDLPDGNKIVTEVIKQGDTGIIVGTFYYTRGAANPSIRSWCGYCDGVLVGCVDCPNNDPVLNCIDNTITCGSKR